MMMMEEMAEERHLLHGANGSSFWNCSRPVCKRVAGFLRGTLRPECKARTAGTAGGNLPQDCDWPWCGCDPHAERVLAAIDEQGLKIVKIEE